MSPAAASPLANLPALPAEPFVTVVLAVRDEVRHIEATLAAALALEWPADRIEFIVADGRSRDGTRASVAALATRDPRVRLIDNPDGFVAHGLNAALAVARGDVVVRVDGHCRVPPGYVRAGVEALRCGAVACAGGPVRASGTTPVARAIALAMSTPFGVGGASFRWAREARDVDHLPFGVWPRAVFDRMGGFDPALVRNQDDEFSDRIRRAGGRIRLLPEQVVEYESRASLAALAHQYFGYGWWKVRVIRKRGGWPSSPRHLVPAALVSGLVAGPIAATLVGVPPLAAIVPAAYLAFLAVAAAVTAVTRGSAGVPLLPAALAVMHVAYGMGFMGALARELVHPSRIAPAALPARATERAPEARKAA